MFVRPATISKVNNLSDRDSAKKRDTVHYNGNAN